jgi:uncharacterized membrane protein
VDPREAEVVAAKFAAVEVAAAKVATAKVAAARRRIQTSREARGTVMTARIVARVGLLAAVYLVLTVLPPFSSFAYGPVQVRVSEALMVLPALTPLAVPALFLGCLAANLAGGLGLVDLVFGSLATLLAAIVVSRLGRRPWLVPLPTILVNALVVGTYLPVILGLDIPLWLSWLYIAAGEAVATYLVGLPLLFFLLRRPDLVALLRAEGGPRD